MKTQGKTIFHVELRKKKEHHYFGSLAAIFDVINADDIYTDINELYKFDVEINKPFINKYVIIRKSLLNRKKGCRGRRGVPGKHNPGVKPIKIDCYNTNGDFIKTYNSVTEICQELNCVSSGIYHMINGGVRYNNIKGFVFKKHPESTKKITKKVVTNSRYI